MREESGARAGRPTGSSLRAVIWDFDGVLLDNELLHLDAELETARTFGIPLTREVAFEYLGVRLEEYFRDLVKRYGPNLKSGPPPDRLLEAMLDRHVATLRRFYRDVFPLTPHAREVLERLAPFFAMGIATNRERELVELALARHRLGPYFGAVLCKEEVQKGKPDPESFLKVASLLGTDPAATAVIEDSHTGFRAAKAAGMFLVARKAAHNGHLDFSLADTVVEDLREVFAIIEPEG